jgi:hypothetical protein
MRKSSRKIRLLESAEFRRKATLVRRIAVLVFAAQKPPGKRIERNHRGTLFLLRAGLPAHSEFRRYAARDYCFDCAFHRRGVIPTR